MSIVGGAPKVIGQEQNQSATITSPNGINAAVIAELQKGEIGIPHLYDNEINFLADCTPNGTVTPDMDQAIFSALTYMQVGPVYSIRAAQNAYYGGSFIPRAGSSNTTSAFNTGYSDLSSISWPNGVMDVETVLILAGKNQGAWNNNIGYLLYPYHAADTLTLVDFNYATATITTHVDTVDVGAILSQGPCYQTGEAVKIVLQNTTDVLPTPLLPNTTYYVISSSANQIQLATSLANALNNQPITLSAGTASCAVAYALLPSPAICKTPGCFTLMIYNRSTQTSNPVLVETFTLSLMNMKDGSGNNVYITDILNSEISQSTYMLAIQNVGIQTDNVMDAYPKAVTGVLSNGIVTPFYFASGGDGIDLTDDDMTDFLSPLYNKDQYNLKFVLDGGHASPVYQAAILSLCDPASGGRGDCFGVFSVPYLYEASSDYLNQVVNYRMVATAFDSSYGAMYSPHVLIYDKYNDRTLYVSPDGFAASIISLSGYMPPFGLNRGKLIVNGLRRVYSPAERDSLFDVNINPLRFIPGKGTYVWGDKTLAAIPSALDGINVRMALTDIEPAIESAMESFLGELVNDSSTQALVQSRCNSYLKQVNSLKGVKEWYVQCDSSNNSDQDAENHTMNLAVWLKPYLSIRYIVTTFIITNQSVQLNQQSIV